MSRYQEERFPFPSPGRLRRDLHLHRPPRWLVIAGVALTVGMLGALGTILATRGRPSSQPRIHFVQDMGVQPRQGPQSVSEVFADGRAMRLPVEGTVARGRLLEGPVELGYVAGTEGSTNLTYLRDVPPQLPLTPALLDRGRVAFGIWCAPCHGEHGDGQGTINLRALQNKESRWVAAPSLLSAELRDREVGQLFNVIRNGIRNMPPYGSQMTLRDRWAVVAYVRQLQQQQQTPASPAPATAPLSIPQP